MDIQAPQSGEVLTAKWLRDFVSFVKANILVAGPGLRINRTPSGSTISLASEARTASGERDAAIAIVTQADDAALTCDIYGNGLSRPPTSTSVRVAATDCATHGSIPAGTVVIVHRFPGSVVHEETVED